MGRKVHLPSDDSFDMTYIALMLLLLCFMVIMVSLAQMEGDKFKKAIGSVRGALSMLSSVPAASMVQDEGLGVLSHKGFSTPEEKEELINTLKEVLESGAGAELADFIEVTEQDSVVTMTLGDLVLFTRGTADLNPSSGPVLDAIQEFLEMWDGSVKVVGHTCDLPVHTNRYPSNWELSVARAVEVVKYFDVNGTDGKRMVAMGSAETDPIVPNDTEANRRRNRRVEIILESPKWNASIPSVGGEEIPG